MEIIMDARFLPMRTFCILRCSSEKCHTLFDMSYIRVRSIDIGVSVFHRTPMSVYTVSLPLSVSLTSSVLQWTLMRWPSVSQWTSVSVITETEMALPRCHQCSLSITVSDGSVSISAFSLKLHIPSRINMKIELR